MAIPPHQSDAQEPSGCAEPGHAAETRDPHSGARLHRHTGGGAHADHEAPAGASTASARRSGRTFKVSGLDCADEVAVLKRELGPLVGGEDRLAFDVLNGRMTVAEEARHVPDRDLLAAVKRTGMSASRWQPGRDEDGADERHRRLQVWLTALSGLAVLAGLALHVWLAGGFRDALRLFGHAGQSMPLPEIVAYAFAVAFGIRYVLVKAWYAARRRRPDINLLMLIAIAGAIGIGQWFEAATVAFLFALSLTLESWSVGRARRAISALLDLSPSTVRALSAAGEERTMAAAAAPVGTRFIVRPGERIALDGRVVAGTSAVDQAPITGESVPVAKEPGEQVFAGTINGDGALEVESTKPAEDTTLARIRRLIEQAHGRRARVEQWVEKFARVYTPAVIALALAIFIVPPALFGAAWADWFYRALVLLVIACPCALVISTPVSIVAALAAAARQGVLIKGGTYIEQPAGLKAIAFDKTGTLTRGRPAVVGIVPFDGRSEQELVECATALESRSSHPLAKAIVEHGAWRGIEIVPAEGVQVLPGKGVVGRFRGDTFWLGSHRYLMERGQEASAAVAERAAALEQAGQTVVVIGNERHVCGLIAIADTVRPEAAGVIRALRARGVGHLIMLTGDNRTTAETIARELGIDEVHAELLPEDKVGAVGELVSRYQSVGMVGDGVNDAPAMARASFGIAMAAAGSDAAIETADIALMTDDLAKLPWLIDHSRRTLAVIRENVAFSLSIKVLFVALTLGGYATLWGAIAADVGASLLVVMNALRLLRGEWLWPRVWAANLSAMGVTVARLSLAALAALVLLYFGSGLFSVQPGEVGIKLRFGRVTAPDLMPGLHYRLPWPFESHRIVPTDPVRRAEFGFRSAAADLGARTLARDLLTVGGPSNPTPNAIQSTGFWFEKQSVPEESFLLTGDGNFIDIRFSVQYRVRDPVAFAYRMAEPEALVRSLTLAALRGVVATGSIDAIYTTDRGAIEQRVQRGVQARLDGYGSGIELLSVGLLYVHPPAEVHDAFRDVASAQEDKLRTINRAETFAVEKVNQSEGEAAAKVEEAKAFEDERVRHAEGDAAAFDLKVDAYQRAPELTRFRLQLETVEAVLPGAQKFVRPGANELKDLDLWLLEPFGGARK